MELLIAGGVLLVAVGLLLDHESHQLCDGAVDQRRRGASVAEAGPDMAAGCGIGIVSLILVGVGVLILLAVINM